MEIRYSTPYVSGLSWILNDPIKENVPIQNESGQRQYRQVVNEPGITFEVTPYLGSVQGQTRNYQFLKGASGGKSMEDVLTAAGIDVATAWANALDQMANIFPILQDPVLGDEQYGPPYYMRLDAWRAVLPWEGNKAVVATLGLYDTATFDNVQAYIQLVFADGSTIRNRNNMITQLEDKIVWANSILSDPPTYEGWDNLPEEEKTRLTNDAEQQLNYSNMELSRLNSQLLAPLGSLLSIAEVQQSIGALLRGCFATLQATEATWADTDPDAIMSKFALPDVS